MKTTLPADSRSWFVYRIYDEHGLPLYVGCTMQPAVRWYQHQNNLSDWVSHARKFKVQGPYTRDVALDIEATAIGAEWPYFNGSRPGRRYTRGQCAEMYAAAINSLGGAA